MSTPIAEIKDINGEHLYLHQFGHKKHKLCLQIGGVWRIPYCQLNKSQVQQLVKELQNWLGETELPWKSNGQIAFENYCRNTYSVNGDTKWSQLFIEQQEAWEKLFP